MRFLTMITSCKICFQVHLTRFHPGFQITLKLFIFHCDILFYLADNFWEKLVICYSNGDKFLHLRNGFIEEHFWEKMLSSSLLWLWLAPAIHQRIFEKIIDFVYKMFILFPQLWYGYQADIIWEKSIYLEVYMLYRKKGPDCQTMCSLL